MKSTKKYVNTISLKTFLFTDKCQVTNDSRLGGYRRKLLSQVENWGVRVRFFRFKIPPVE